MKIGIIDADLLDGGTRHPNLALMKISGYEKESGHDVKLVDSYDPSEMSSYDEIYMSKVFSFTRVRINPEDWKNLHWGGTGFFGDKAPNLRHEVEHHMPDYSLYNHYIAKEIERGIKPQRFSDYMDYSIGFTTRGCFRKCEFCVNKKYNHVFRHALVSEFFDKSRPHIYLWDDNILGYSKWNDVFDELEDTGRHFQFRQGMDMRLMTDEKAKRLSSMKYRGDFIFAFDHVEEKEVIAEKLKLWKKHTNKTTKLYVLCGFDSIDETDIANTFERIHVLMQHKCLPYIMRYESYKQSQYRGMYIDLARWCNQPDFFKKKSFREYCHANGERSSTWRYLCEFEHDHPDIAARYFDLRYDQEGLML